MNLVINFKGNFLLLTSNSSSWWCVVCQKLISHPVFPPSIFGIAQRTNLLVEKRRNLFFPPEVWVNLFSASLLTHPLKFTTLRRVDNCTFWDMFYLCNWKITDASKIILIVVLLWRSVFEAGKVLKSSFVEKCLVLILYNQ